MHLAPRQEAVKSRYTISLLWQKTKAEWFQLMLSAFITTHRGNGFLSSDSFLLSCLQFHSISRECRDYCFISFHLKRTDNCTMIRWSFLLAQVQTAISESSNSTSTVTVSMLIHWRSNIMQLLGKLIVDTTQVHEQCLLRDSDRKRDK